LHFQKSCSIIIFMRIGTEKLTDRIQSGRSIYRSAKYFNDLGQYLDTTLSEFYNHVKNIPYKEDESAEIVGRPKYLFDFPALDCKKKAVLIGSWLEAHGIPWRLIAVSERPDRQIHHVFNQAWINNNWRNIDATYSDYKLFEAKPEVTAAEELPR